MKSLVLAGVILHFLCTVRANPVLLGLDVLGHADLSDNCPFGYSQPANSNWTYCYKIHTDFKSRKDAASQCALDNGKLASVPNAFVNSYLYYLATNVGATSFWLGNQCLSGDQNTCTNDDGTPFIYDSFNYGQPNDDGNCVYMCDAGKCSQKWQSFACEQDFQYACEVKPGTYVPPRTTQSPTTTTTTKPSSICPAGYTFYNRMCYMKSDIPVGENRQDQSAFCRRVPGGNLATIPNLDVDVFLQNLPSSNPYFRIGLTCPRIGFNGDTSSCIWDDGTPFVFNYFAKGYPKKLSRNACVYVYNFKWLNDGDSGCDVPFSCSICQAPPLF